MGLRGEKMESKIRKEKSKRNNENVFLKELRENKWMGMTLVFGLILILLIVLNIIQVNNEERNENKILCSIISKTPAWASDGKLVGYGTMFPEDYSVDLVNSILIPNRIKFLYYPDCIACEAQINYLNGQGTWEEYVKENLTIDCSKYY